jgi:adenine/guanine phosphoribosyltransferase-like PRPP-binding protein
MSDFGQREGRGRAAELFAQDCLFRRFDKRLQQLQGVVPLVPDFPRSGIQFRHVLDIAQQIGGLPLCVSLLLDQRRHEWLNGNGDVTFCETGGFIFASAFAAKYNVRSALIREGGKLPPPTISVPKPVAYLVVVYFFPRSAEIVFAVNFPS